LNDCRPKARSNASTRQRNPAPGSGGLGTRAAVGAMLVCALLALAACGQKGDLYLPDETPEDSARR
jgi:hypothetical protein